MITHLCSKQPSCADFVFFGQAAEQPGSSYILRGQREGAKIVLKRSIAGLFGSCNYIFATFVERTLLKCSFVDRSLVGGDSSGALYRAINVLEARVLLR